MDLSSFGTLGALGVTAALAALVAGWQQVRGFLQQLASIFIVTIEFSDVGAIAARIYCRRCLRRMPPATRFFWSSINYIRPKRKHGLVFWEHFFGSNMYFRGWVPIWGSTTSDLSSDESWSKYTLRFIRGTIGVDQLFVDIDQAAEVAAIDVTRFKVVRKVGRSAKAVGNFGVGGNNSNAGKTPTTSGPVVGGKHHLGRNASKLAVYREEDIGEPELKVDPLERLALSHSARQAVLAVERWHGSKDWYAERSIPWRFGLGLYGAPGTGKSSLVKALGQRLNLPIYVMDVATMDNEEFHEAFQEVLAYAPSIVLIEDIDATFRGRENVAAEKGKGLTFDCLLNVVSGVEVADGVLLVVTTNHVGVMDAALGSTAASGSVTSRPGRLDVMVEMLNPDEPGRRKIAQRILAGRDPSLVDKVVGEGADDTGAQFENRCAMLALELYWSREAR